jgi:hypothetical protein
MQVHKIRDGEVPKYIAICKLIRFRLFHKSLTNNDKLTELTNITVSLFLKVVYDGISVH